MNAVKQNIVAFKVVFVVAILEKKFATYLRFAKQIQHYYVPYTSTYCRVEYMSMICK